MSKNKKIILGILTFWPIVYLLIFFVIFFTVLMPLAFNEPQASESTMLTVFPVLFAVHMATVIIMFSLLATYLYLIYKNKYLSSELKILWALGALFVGMIIYPIYWFMYVWNGPTKK